MRSSTKKRVPPHYIAGRKRSFYLIFFLILFYLVRTRYYFDFLLLSVAEQAGLRLTRSKLQNFDFLPLSITDLVGSWLNGSNPQWYSLILPVAGLTELEFIGQSPRFLLLSVDNPQIFHF